MFQCNLKIKFFIQYSRHYFELTQKKHEMTRKPVDRLDIQTADGLDSEFEGNSAISDEKDALKETVNKRTMTWAENRYVR